MLSDYLPIVVLLALSLGFVVASIAAAALLSPYRPSPAKSAPYECGIVPERMPKNERFPVKFYVVAMLFIIFDIETIFLYPWAVTFRSMGLFGLGEMVLFIALVFVAYIYIWREGGLDWAVSPARRPSKAERDATARSKELEAAGAR